MAIDTIGANALSSNSVTTAKIAADAVTSAKIPADAVVATDIADGSITTAKLADNAVTSAKAINLGRRNIVINGGMKVAQRSGQVTGIGASNGYFTVDRFNVKRGNLAGRLTMQQDQDTPEGFTKSLKLDCTTADAGVEAGQYFMINYNIEGQDLQQIKKGTSNAEKVTVSFYAKGTAKTYVCEFDDSDNNRHNSIPFTVSSSWTRHTFVFNADTTGAFTKDNNLSGSINIWLSGGTSFSGGSYTANTWVSRQATDNTRAVGVGNFFDNTSNELFITGLQMEVGDTATDFEHRSFDEERDLCYRYYYKESNTGTSGHCHNWTTAQGHGYIHPAKPMRANPTGGNSSGTGNITFYTDAARTSDMSSNTSWNISNTHFPFIQVSGLSQTAGFAGWYTLASGVYLELDAEL